MIKYPMFFLSLAALAVAPSFAKPRAAGAATKGAPAAAPANDTWFNDRMSVAGITLGMSPSSVLSVAKAAGYKVSWSFSDLAPWNMAVFYRAQALLPDAVKRPPNRTPNLPSHYDFNDGKGQRLIVNFEASPTGAVVSNVYYTMSPVLMEKSQFQELIRNRYGEFPQQSGRTVTGVTYCSRGDQTCVDQLTSVVRRRIAEPYLSSSWQDYRDYSIGLTEGENAPDRRKALIDEEARKLLPKTNSVKF